MAQTRQVRLHFSAISWHYIKVFNLANQFILFPKLRSLALLIHTAIQQCPIVLNYKSHTSAKSQLTSFSYSPSSQKALVSPACFKTAFAVCRG
ncbi:hypothetical protein [Phormidesmis priestleyi]|uniref:hypothetical protein n=1 Tax=Phormidesmis priestleyi TaxID=268141 RepID=UPI0011601A13|nr:hypothetical protein [Phormidesmis priestleyi]